MGWESLSDEDLLRVTREMADRCVAVVALEPSERARIEPHRGCSPEQAGALSAALVTQALQEIERRGL